LPLPDLCTKRKTVRLRIELDLKKQASEILSDLGLDFSTAIRMFLRQVVEVNGIPFDIQKPNKVTIAAMEEAREISKRNKQSQTE
jgi:DNA-damage-inducible protein J